MNIADLHIHSSFSDGTLSPEEIVSLAQKKKIKYVSITDHDNLRGTQKAIQFVEKNNIHNVQIVPGIEISTSIKGFKFHLLAYFVDVNNKKLNECLSKIQLGRIDFAKFAVKKLNQLGIKIDFGDILNINNVKGSLGRLHIAIALTKLGIVKTHNEAFQQFLNGIKEDYPNSYEPDAISILKLIEKSGGVCSVAHPHTIFNFKKILPDLVSGGLFGIELKQDRKTAEIMELLDNYKLVKTAGSDLHFPTQKKFMGKDSLTEEQFLSMYNMANKKLGGRIFWKL